MLPFHPFSDRTTCMDIFNKRFDCGVHDRVSSLKAVR